MAFTFFFRDIHTLERAIEFLLPLVTGRSKIKSGMLAVLMDLNPIHSLYYLPKK